MRSIRPTFSEGLLKPLNLRHLHVQLLLQPRCGHLGRLLEVVLYVGTWTGLLLEARLAPLTYGVGGLAVLHHVQAADLVGGVHAELADGLHRAWQHGHTLALAP